ncbi:AraC family two component transcriptional regulator [Kineothrix alysoides]|uniref:Stage 0 sporulation protein A homolog n=1 Tax=Kineothrix alysoides TaxID=1469948 RepID=A0A4R1QTZ0_9FIRM|nr:response regulator [Kineothrix alysoides]TCL56967.1 AraC family two component transcriptional regulator [Kineothrix alysoides]
MKTIVIVEDEFRIRQGLGSLINKVDMGCKVIGEAENGYEGLKMIQDLEPDIVITDIQMPKIDGLQMIEKAKEMGAACTFVILSGYADFEYARRGMRLGVKEYLLKPATISSVKELLLKLAGNGEEAYRPGEEEYSEMVKEMIAIMEKSYGMRLGLDTFAEKFRLTPEYISNLFAKETKMTFSNYLKKVRIEKAKELILSTDMKIYEVACSVGYSDQKYFSKVFKEYTGVSAKQFAIDVQKNTRK